jgi:hypothetical protein
MGLFMRRRRPVMRLAAGAAVAGTAYHMGKKGAEQSQVNEQAQDAYAATQGPPPAAPAAAPVAAPTDAAGEVERLAQLHASGALTDAEFSAAKAKALGI